MSAPRSVIVVGAVLIVGYVAALVIALIDARHGNYTTLAVFFGSQLLWLLHRISTELTKLRVLAEQDTEIRRRRGGWVR